MQSIRSAFFATVSSYKQVKTVLTGKTQERCEETLLALDLHFQCFCKGGRSTQSTDERKNKKHKENQSYMFYKRVFHSILGGSEVN